MIKKSVKSEIQNLNNSRNWSNKTTAPFSFYEAMNYPIPDSKSPFSRTQKNPHLESFLQIIRQRQRIFRYIPFVETVFLANSLSFNACKENSDIDLFIITKSNHLRTARLITSLVMAIIGIKRILSKFFYQFWSKISPKPFTKWAGYLSSLSNCSFSTPLWSK